MKAPTRDISSEGKALTIAWEDMEKQQNSIFDEKMLMCPVSAFFETLSVLAATSSDKQ
jgi:hypothetical protein